MTDYRPGETQEQARKYWADLFKNAAQQVASANDYVFREGDFIGPAAKIRDLPPLGNRPPHSPFTFRNTGGDPVLTAEIQAVVGKTADEIEQAILADPNCPKDLSERHRQSVREFAEGLASMYGPKAGVAAPEAAPPKPVDPYGKFRVFEERSARIDKTLDQRIAAARSELADDYAGPESLPCWED